MGFRMLAAFPRKGVGDETTKRSQKDVESKEWDMMRLEAFHSKFVKDAQTNHVGCQLSGVV